MGKIIKKIDEFDNIHYIETDNELGRGGQGVVYKTKNADTVIKIALDNELPIKDPTQIKSFHKKIKKLIFKPLPIDINIARPVTVLKDEAGYVMQLLNGMEPFSRLLPQELKKEEAANMEIPVFLEELSKRDKRAALYFTHYNKSGGLRKRLYTLSRLAIVLNRLHTRGLVYFDISHNNVFINKDDIPLVYLIDADNIEYESINKQTVYTPNFEVPELMQNSPNSTYSDIYAFGILSFLTLTTKHPFDGEGLEEEDWDTEAAIKKEKWELPWIEDSNDDSNKSKAGLRGHLTITKELNILFHKLFEGGKFDKYQRPTLPLWIELLEKAACKTIKCSSCNMSYYNDVFDKCPYCESEKPKRLIVKSYYYIDGKKQEERWEYVREILEGTKIIEVPNYLFKSFDILKVDDVFLEIKFSRQTRIELSFNKTGDEKIFFESETSKPIFNKKSIRDEELKKGISIVTFSDIKTLVEIKIEL
ncbi:hypothetical protein V6246_00735 [Algibacter sp. TI.3.09]|uniref:protein kinase domain-containing protein n=1 Tax=Algibacter sp. TI.3.09 TaxID=3121298 RepID=UPI00311FCE2E